MGNFDASKELRKLNKIIENLPKDKKQLAASLIADASFQAEQLEKLRDYISEHGWSEEYQNGANQFGKKTSVEADSYVKLQKAYLSTFKQIVDLLPDSRQDAASVAGENLTAFIAKGKGIELG